MKTLEKKSIAMDTLVIDGIPVAQGKPLLSMKKFSLRPRKSFTRVKSLRPLKAAGNKGNESAELALD